jgi:hypothetical protein
MLRKVKVQVAVIKFGGTLPLGPTNGNVQGGAVVVVRKFGMLIYSSYGKSASKPVSGRAALNVSLSTILVVKDVLDTIEVKLVF